MENEQLPAWYESTQGPEISATAKALAGEIIPVIKDLFGIQLGTATFDHIVNAVLILGFSAYALYGYIRAKRTLQTKIDTLGKMLDKKA